MSLKRWWLQLDDDLFEEQQTAHTGEQILLAKVIGISGQTAKIQVDGSTIDRFYKIMQTGATLAANDRVVVAKISGSYVILGKIT